MIGKEKLEAYRRMSPAERWREVEALMDFAWRSLLELPTEERNRRLDLLRDQHDASDRILLDHLRKHS